MKAEIILKDAIVGVVCDELDYEHGNFQYYKEEVLQAMQEYAELYARIQIEKDRERVNIMLIRLDIGRYTIESAFERTPITLD